MATMLPPDINGRLSPDGDRDRDGDGVKPDGGHHDGDHHHRNHHRRRHHNHDNQLAPPDGHATPPPTPTPAEVAATGTTPARQSEQEPSPLASPLPSPLPTPGVGGINHSRSHRIRSFGPHERDTTGRSRGATRIRTYAAASDGEDQASRFPRISRPVELMRSSYDCVVIGSGYGGAVAASRVARSEGVADGRRRTVCVLERGREKWPGEYPSKTAESLAELHVTGDFAPGSLPGHLVDEGDPTGMYHLIFGKGLNAVVGNGLGGTSLMNANVFLEADRGTLGLPQWPAEIRDDPACLDKYYQKARDVLEPVEYPDDWPVPPKVDLLRRQAEALGMTESFHMVPQTTRFRDGPNSCGVEMLTSAGTGQDTTGVNDGSKTTTLVTYLADAWNWGAEMFCECEVRHVERAVDRPEGGYIVYFAWHGRGRGRFRVNMEQDLMWVHARECVFLGAGAIGTTEILLRSRDMGGLPLSGRVGTGMSGNGDMLAFGYNTESEANAIGRPQPDPYRIVGPTINAVIDRRTAEGAAENPLDGFVIEEGAIPRALAPFLQALLEHMPGREPPPRKPASYVAAARARLASWTSRLLGPYFRGGALENTQVYLVMSHDSSQAALTLKDDKPVLEFQGVGRSDHVRRLNDLLAKATHAVGGTFVRNPFEALMGQQQVTVHPIGGACMASDGTADTGATNHVGELFTGVGAETHAGLVVADASVIPAALGVNPLATITALAERSVEHWCRSRGLRIHTKPNGLLDLFGEPQHAPLSPSDEDDNVEDDDDDEDDVDVDGDQGDLAKGHAAKEYRLGVRAVEASEAVGIRGLAAQLVNARALRAAGFGFTEVMTGHLHYNNNRHRPRPHDHHPAGGGEARPAGHDDTPGAYRRAARTAQRLCETARFFLSTEALSTAQLVRDVNHASLLTGTFACPAIPGSPFMVQRGEFDLFVDDCRAPGTKNLTYDFDLRGVDGRLLHFHGYKVVDSSVALAPVQFWRATSTLYVTVTEPGPASRRRGGGERRDPHAWRDESVLARGIMQIRPSDFVSQVLTMSPTGAGLLARAVSAASFLTYFTRRSVSLLLTPFTPLQYPLTWYRGSINETPPTASFDIFAADGIKTRMHMWKPTHVPRGAGGGVRNLFLVPGASVDHQIFALPTIPYNAVNYFTRAGYRVFVAVHRIGQLPVARNNWTTFDARKDVRACLEVIRGRRYAADNGPENRVYVVSHCMGSVVFSAGLLDGTVPASWIRGISASQVLMNPIWTTMNMAKVLMGPVPADRLYEAAGGSWFSCGTTADDGLLQRVINQALRLYPETRREMCSSASCHRCSLIFGRLWNHANLNEATHRQIDRFFGGVSMQGLRLLMRQGFEGHVMNNYFERLTTAENVQRLRGLPVMLFVGADNAVLSTEATERTYETLCNTFGSSDETGGIRYRRRVVQGYGHLDCWMGRHAWRDVYPIVREEIDRVCRGEEYAFEEPDDRFSAMVEGGGMLY